MIELLLLIFPIIIYGTAGLIWHYLSEKTKKRYIEHQKKLKKKYGVVEAPFSEWRYPVMFLAISGLLFILLITMFGIQINMQTGETLFEVDWELYFDKETGLHDRWMYNIFEIWVGTHQLEVLALMLLGYYMTSIFLIYFYFDYCKWKWLYLKNKE